MGFLVLSTFAVEFVHPDRLPPEHDWAMVYSGIKSDRYVFFIKKDRITEASLEAAWEAYRRLAAHVVTLNPHPPHPRQPMTLGDLLLV